MLRAAALLTLLVSLAPGPLASQEPSGVRVAGRVTDASSGDPIASVWIQVEGLEDGVLSDEEGRFAIRDLPAGLHTLRATRIGYATRRIRVRVPASGVLRQDIVMAEEALELEGLVVTADPAGRARGELGTADVIEREAIRAQTATSLAGLLELVPGVPLSPPGLEGVQQIGLRSVSTSGTGTLDGGTSASDVASFGTLIILDGVPLSNNANLQTVGPRGELSFSTSAGGGVDLRSIPAATLERVEVIRGVPSVRYGDLTHGAIVVETRAAEVDTEITGQLDPRTAETSALGGRRAGAAHAVSLNGDVARTSSEPAVTDDEQLRVAGQVAHRFGPGPRAASGRGRLTLDTRLDVFRLVDDRPENESFRPGTSSRSRDMGLRISERARLALGPSSRLSLTAAYTRLDQDSWATAERVRHAQPFTDRTEPGRQEGRFVEGRYDAVATLDGMPQLLYARLELDHGAGWLGLDHRLQGGVEVGREWNAGAGYQFDMEFPPQSRFNGVQGYDRPRRYDEVPPLATTAAYLGDRLTAELGPLGRVSAQGGVRVDLLHEGGDVLSVRDAVVQPRVTAEVTPREWLRIRGGWGRTAKAPPLALLSPAPQYHDIVNVNYFANDPAERLAVLTTFVLDPTDLELGFARATKAEAGVELAWRDAVVSLTAFHDEIEGSPAIRRVPVALPRDRFQLTDSVLGNGIPPEIIEPPHATDTVPVLLDRPDNHVDQENRGIELTAFLPEIRALRTRLQVQGSHVRTRQSSDALHFGSASRFRDFQLIESIRRVPYWLGAVEEGSRTMLTYRAIHHQPELGLVITGTVQHNVRDTRRDFAGTDTLAFAGYLTSAGELVPVPPARRGDPEFADLRVPRTGVLRSEQVTPSDVLVSLQVSKTLPLGGRISFWAFNVLDNRGRAFAPEVRPRSYPPVRFGLELRLVPRFLLER